MRNPYSYPLLFFFLAAALGLFLRWQFIDSIPGIRYAWFLHSHSHVMFLGWVFNVLYLSFTESHLPEKDQSACLKLFTALQVLVVAMMISFPLQGYGMYSILFSTLHTLAVMVFIVIVFTRRGNRITLSLWFGRVAWIFFFISTAGPFSLGYLMANGLGDTVWYNFSIYYYLHFQYNGFFLFGILSLFFELLERKNIAINAKRAKKFGVLMAIACVPAYALSLLFAKPGLFFNGLGAAAAILQLFALILLLRELRSIRSVMVLQFNPTVNRILLLVIIALVLKSFLQLFSAHPFIAQLAYELRPVVIAYLHLVIVGIITFFLLAWYMDRRLVSQPLSGWAFSLLIAGFSGSELCLVIMPWWSRIIGEGISSAPAIFAFSVLMFTGAFFFYLAFLLRNKRLDSPVNSN